eukprot:XP_011669377.1 PREDICTED: uncharacterized protein LOC105440651 [Strongylocentrotus purpuratus]
MYKSMLRAMWELVSNIRSSSSLLVSSDASMNETKTCCTDRFGLNYTLPMFFECPKKGHPNGSMVQTIPKLIPYSFGGGGCPRRESKLGVPPGRRVCRFPDCDMNPCENGWCEETMTGYRCRCPIGFQGKQCHELDINQPATTQGIVVTCVKDITVTVELGTLNKSVEFTPPSAVNREGTVVLVSQNYISGDDFPVGSTYVEYIFADESGNLAPLCTFNVYVNTVDTTPPVVQSCPSNQTFSVLKTTTPIAWTPPTASDASGIAFIVANHEPGVNVSVNSPISVIYTVTDNSGLVNTNCSFNITLVSVETEWECTPSKCYRLGASSRNWQDAHDFCPTLGPITTAAGDRTPSLLFVDSEELPTSQLASIFRKIQSFSYYVWLNCNDMETEGLFMCEVDGKGAVQINSTDWVSGQPNGSGNENCVTLSRRYKWHDITCLNRFSFVCQIVI